MGTVYRLLSFRYLVQRWDRAALVAASIALGVATLVSTFMLNACIESAAANTTTPLHVSDLYVTNGELLVEQALADRIRAANVTGVASVQPLVVDRVYLPDQDNRAAVILGVELAKYQLPKTTDDPFEVLNGENAYRATFTRVTPSASAALGILLSRLRPIVLSRELYDTWVRQRADSDVFRVRYGGRTVDCTPVAVVDYTDKSPLFQLGNNVIGMEIGRAAEFLRPDNPRVNRIDLMVTPGADKAAVKAAVEAVVGEEARVRTPQDQGKSTQDVVSGVQTGFTTCAVGAMVVGLFLVYNALAVTVAERRHDIGVMRSMGATRSQVVKVFVAAAVLLGLVGAAAGIPLGVGLARIALHLIRDDLASMFTSPTVDPGTPAWWMVGAAVAAGVATAVLASLIPAVQAAHTDPAAAVRRTPGGVGGVWRLAHRLACGLLVGGGLALIFARHSLPARVGAFGGMVAVLVGMLLSAPIMVATVVQLLQPLLRAVLPIEARLAADNLLRAPGRTGLVIGALAAGVAVMIQTAGVGRSNEEPITRWLDEILQAEQFLAAGNVTEAIASQAPCPQELVGQVAAIPGVESAAGIRYVRPEYAGTVVFLTAIDIDKFVGPTQKRGANGVPQLDKFKELPYPPDHRAAGDTALAAAAGGAALKYDTTRADNGVLVSDNFALHHHVAAGDTLVLQGPHGPVKLLVLDTVTDYSWSQGSIFIDRGVYARLFQDTLVDIVHVFLTTETADEREAARGRVNQFAADRGYFTADRTALRRMVGELIERIYKLVNLQQIVVGVVAALGVVTSLLISVLQRKRELGLLLAVGATPGQVVRTVLAEAVLMGVLGTLLGFAIGVPLEWYVLRVVLYEFSGFNFELLLPWGQALGIAGGAVLVATLAGLFPALQAVKTRIADAIAYE